MLSLGATRGLGAATGASTTGSGAGGGGVVVQAASSKASPAGRRAFISVSVESCRMPGMPVGHLLIAMGGIQEPGFGKIVADELQPDRQAVGKAAGNRHTR